MCISRPTIASLSGTCRRTQGVFVKIKLAPWTAAIAGTATVWTLDSGQVIQVQYLQTEAQLRQALSLLP